MRLYRGVKQSLFYLFEQTKRKEENGEMFISFYREEFFLCFHLR